MKALLVCIDYSDILRLTLPYNHHHFSEVHVVTCSRDMATQVLCTELRHSRAVPNVICHITDLFYKDGALLNKFRALEWALDKIGRQGWICLMDADICWPKKIELSCLRDRLYTPFRRMAPKSQSVPHEAEWKSFPLQRLHTTQPYHFSGYTQIFHTDCPYLGSPPWHRIDLSHCGGGDTFFMEKWPIQSRVRSPWDVLHLGDACTNWAGVGNKEKLRELLLSRVGKKNDPMHWSETIKPT